MITSEIKYTITLLSDTCCGSGTGNGTDVDISASFDEHGLPMIPSKRLRGLLREQAFILEEKYGRDSVVDLFGDSGKKSRLIVESGEIPDAKIIKAEIDPNEYSPAEVSAVFSAKHTQTAIDAKTGVAKDVSLRTIETVVSGTVFVGKIIIENPGENDIGIITDAFRLLRTIGLDKHRGLGEVECKTEIICAAKDNCAPASFASSDDCAAVEYTVILDQNIALMLNSPMQNPDYISGAAVQGAFARYFADKNYFANLFFNDLKFGNAYITDGEHTFIPAPMSLVKVKNEADTVYNLANGFVKDALKQYVPCNGYVCMNYPDIYSASVKRGMDYHINKGKNNGYKSDNETKFYNTEIIRQGQIFKGLITGSKAAIDLIKTIVPDNIIRLGAAVSSEYGKCKISFKDAALAENKKYRKGDTVVVTLLSDTILLDSLGNNTVKLNDLIESLGGGLVPCKDSDENQMIYTKTTVTGGYNSKWGMPKSQYNALAKGSTFVFKCENDISIPAFIGIGNCEGYGFVVSEIQSKDNQYSSRDNKNTHNYSGLSSQSLKITDKIVRKRTAEEVEKYAVEVADKLFDKDLSASASTRLLSTYQNMSVSGAVTKEEFELRKAKDYQHNEKLLRLADKIVRAFTENDYKDDMFETYIRSFIIRYKELNMFCIKPDKGDAKK